MTSLYTESLSLLESSLFDFAPLSCTETDTLTPWMDCDLLALDSLLSEADLTSESSGQQLFSASSGEAGTFATLMKGSPIKLAKVRCQGPPTRTRRSACSWLQAASAGEHSPRLRIASAANVEKKTSYLFLLSCSSCEGVLGELFLCRGWLGVTRWLWPKQQGHGTKRQ